MITCGLASSRYPALLKIARVRNPDYTKLGALDSPMLGIDFVVHPDVEAARAILRAVEHGALGDVLSIGETSFELGAIDVGPDASFAGKTVRDFRMQVGKESLVTLIERGETRIVPTGKSVIEPGDRIHVVAREKDLGGIFELAGRKMRPLRRIGIVGGSRIGSLVVEGLIDDANNVNDPPKSLLTFLRPRKSHNIVLIEKDYRLCKDLSQKYPGILILNEDISDEGFIDEENITDLDLMVTATDNQELNMIAAIYLKTRGVGRTISLVNSSGYAAIARRLGVDVVVPLKSVVVDSILSHLIGGGIRSVHRVADGSVEILDMELGPATRAANRRLGDLKLSEGSLVMLVTRSGDTFIPTGDCVFSPGDRVVLIVRKGGEAEAERTFGQEA
jgi:trk system potassium uptake protein TrkA